MWRGVADGTPRHMRMVVTFYASGVAPNEGMPEVLQAPTKAKRKPRSTPKAKPRRGRAILGVP
jgi:hypothetical protein